MADFIPKNETGKLNFLRLFAEWVNANGTTHGLSTTEVAEFVAMASAAPAAVDRYVEARKVARVAVVSKEKAVAAAIKRARLLARRIQAAPNTTDADRAAAGLKVPDRIPTRLDPDAIHKIDPPLVRLDFSIRHQIIVHWGPNPHNEHENGRPAGVAGAKIQYCRGGIPEGESDWLLLDITNESPYIHEIHENQPTTYTYRVCYINKQFNSGPFGDPATCTVGV